MKKIIYATGILAAIALSFSACQKEQEIKDEPQSGKLVTVSFTAEKAGTETRTGIKNEGTTVSYEWTEEDANNLKLFTVSNTNSGETLTQVSNPVVSVTATKLTISAQVEANATYTFRAVIAGTWTNDGKKPRINVEQSPSSTGYGYDPNADVLVSNDVDVTVGESETTTGELPMAFERKVVINKMTLLNMTAGEKVSKVVISSDKNLAGTLTGDKDAITVNYSDAEVPSSGEFPVYFVTIPNEGQTLTVEVTTDNNVYSKTFASTISFILGQFTKFKVNLPAGIPNTALSLPLVDAMGWAMTGGEDETSELQVSALTAVQGSKKIYNSVTKAFKGGTGLKLGTKNDRGSIATNDIDLSSPFYVTIDAKTFGTDNSQLVISVDDNDLTPISLSGEFKTYSIDCSAATDKSRITIGIAGVRGYIKNLAIRSGASPVINLVSTDPIEVENTGGQKTISYSIANPIEGASLTASTEATWITNISYPASGQVTFDVAQQADGADARSGIIVLSYPGSSQKTVIVNQAEGASSANSYEFTFTSKDWKATLDGNEANWYSGQDGGQFTNGGIQVSKTYTGANGTSPYSFTGVEKVVLTYCTNASSGAGTIEVQIGSVSQSVSVNSTGGTTPRTCSVVFDSKLTGSVKVTVNCTTNSIYLIGATIKAQSYEEALPAPSLSVSSTELNWGATDTGAKTITVTANRSGYSISPTSDDNWYITDSEGTITVSPKAANTSNTDAKTLTLTITHKDDATLSEEVVCTQAKVSSSSGQDVEVLSEDFSSITSGNSTSTSGSGTAWTGNDNFPTVSRAYQAGGSVKLGGGSNNGSITSKSMDLSKSFTVTLDIKGWTNVEGKINVKVGSVTKTIDYTETMSDSFGTYSVVFDAATSTSTVTISTTAKRAFIDNIVITRHD